VFLYSPGLKEHIPVFIIIFRPKLQELRGVEVAPPLSTGAKTYQLYHRMIYVQASNPMCPPPLHPMATCPSAWRQHGEAEATICGDHCPKRPIPPPLTISTLADYPWISENPSLWNSNICNLTYGPPSCRSSAEASIYICYDLWLPSI
jgi:hypothetical protein